jgi:hypothetical protein
MPGRRLLCLLLVLGLQAAVWAKKPVPPGRILRAPDPAARLVDRLQWAGREADSAAFRKGYWVGYAIQRFMGERSFIGSWPSRTGHEEPTIESLVSLKKEGESPKRSDEEILRETARQTLEAAERRGAPERQVRKEIGIFLRFGPDSRRGPVSAEVSDLRLSFDFESLPLLWIGPAKNDESVSRLEALYRAADSWDKKESLLAAVSIHQEPRAVIPFLDGVLKSPAPQNIRCEAAEALGEQDDAQAVAILRRVIQFETSTEVRESAISGLAEMSRPEALELLIETARRAPDESLRREAVRGLAEKAADKIRPAVGRRVVDDRDAEVQRRVVEVMGELPPAEALPHLARIAETHSSPEVRRAAVEALGELKDPAAVTILVKLIKGRF